MNFMFSGAGVCSQFSQKGLQCLLSGGIRESTFNYISVEEGHFDCEENLGLRQNATVMSAIRGYGYILMSELFV